MSSSSQSIQYFSSKFGESFRRSDSHCFCCIHCLRNISVIIYLKTFLFAISCSEWPKKLIRKKKIITVFWAFNKLLQLILNLQLTNHRTWFVKPKMKNVAMYVNNRLSMNNLAEHVYYTVCLILIVNLLKYFVDGTKINE